MQRQKGTLGTRYRSIRRCSRLATCLVSSMRSRLRGLQPWRLWATSAAIRRTSGSCVFLASSRRSI
jgi:hypothetical protein